jgi:hypothetical protein
MPAKHTIHGLLAAVAETIKKLPPEKKAELRREFYAQMGFPNLLPDGRWVN